MEPDRSLLVFGAGAVGGYLGGKLANHCGDARVTLVARPRIADAISLHGLTVKEGGTELHVRPAAVASTAGLSEPDVIVLTVRTYDVDSALPDLEPLMGPDTYLVALQNGVGTEECLASALGRNRVIAGTLTAAVRSEAAGVVERVSTSGGLAASAMDGEIPTRILDLFAGSGLPVTIVNDYRSLRWSKLLLNMLGAATSAILDMDLAEIVADRRTFRIEQLAFLEATTVMDALGATTVGLPGYPVPLTRSLMRLPASFARALVGGRLARSRGGRSPAMRADLQRGRTEVRSLHGAVARAGEGLQLDTPVNRALTRLIEDLSSEPGRRHAFHRNPEALSAYLREQNISI